jgi:hypothetical protein
MSAQNRTEISVQESGPSGPTFWVGGPPPGFSFSITVTADKGQTAAARDALRLVAYDVVARLDALAKTEDAP